MQGTAPAPRTEEERKEVARHLSYIAHVFTEYLRGLHIREEMERMRMGEGEGVVVPYRGRGARAPQRAPEPRTSHRDKRARRGNGGHPR